MMTAAVARLPIPTEVSQTPAPSGLDASLDRLADDTRTWLANVAPLDRPLSSPEIGAILDRLHATQAQLQGVASQSNKLQQTIADVQNAIGVYSQLQQNVQQQEWQRQYYQQAAVQQAQQQAQAGLAQANAAMGWQFGMPPVGYNPYYPQPTPWGYPQGGFPHTWYPYHN
ncbi:MAG TPA: hypothetical protein VGO93_23410 [Candidatus Xenobia bacterium]